MREGAQMPRPSTDSGRGGGDASQLLGRGGADTQKGLSESLPNDYLLILTAFSGVKSSMSGKTKSCVTRAQNMWKK